VVVVQVVVVEEDVDVDGVDGSLSVSFVPLPCTHSL